MARNSAEVIVDLFRETAPPRDYERLVELVQQQIERVQWLAKKPLLEEIRRLRGE